MGFRGMFSIVVLVIGGALLAGAFGERRAERVALFDGKTLEGWTTLDGKPVTRGWEVVDGTIHRASRGGDIITTGEFGDFDLRFEWKIARGANSGLKYKFTRFDGRWLGCEYQVIDDGKEGKRTKGSAGALYDICEPNEKKRLRPVGEFNTSRVIVRGSRIEHWLNGEKIIDIDTSSPEWSERIARSKFGKVDGFGKNPRGRIMLQDHGGEVWFRRLTVRRLERSAKSAD